jgi:serine/threonine-protein kinase
VNEGQESSALTDSHAATLNDLLTRALALPAEQRAAWIETLDPELDSIKPRLRAILARSGRHDRRALSTLPKVVGAVTTQSGADESELRVGMQIDRYRLQRELGSGGMGVVWLAHEQTGRQVALKFAHSRSPRSGVAHRLAREQKLLAALEHPNIGRLFGAGVTAAQQLYLVLEYIEGEPLDQYCERRNTNLAQRFALFVQIADALTHAHERRIVHRDLKPSNVLVTSDGETRLLDFGVAKLLHVHGPTTPKELQLSVMSGRPLTPEYASPEQLLDGDVGFASDIYSLAVMLYEQATGVRPYPCKRGSNRALRDAILGNPPPAPSEMATSADARDQLRGATDAMLLKALAKRPDQRHASMRELANEIEQNARTLMRRHFATSSPPQPTAAGDDPPQRRPPKSGMS